MKKKKILTTLSTLETKGLSNLCDRTEIQKKSLLRYVKQKYAAHVIQRYLLLLRHFYDFIICENINKDGLEMDY